jgi:Carbonic anhydrases/acetyltransferases, isoleucine patch superfamily
VRKIGLAEIGTFFVLLACAIALAVATTTLLLGSVPLGDFRGVVLVATGVVLFYAFAILVYRVFQRFMPLVEGEIAAGSREEFAYHVHVLFFLVVFYTVMRGGACPIPLLRVFYQALGANLGENTYSAGIIHDPCLVDIGAYSTVGQYAVLVPHVIEGARLAHFRIRVGNHVTIGTHAVILPGVVIGDGALIAAGAVVLKGTRIGANEVWGGVPARRIDSRLSVARL